MPGRFTDALTHGFAQPVRYRRGDAINTWGSKVNALADKLDGMDVPIDVAEVLRELFEEIGQQARDASAF